ncbi:hypothetical protein NYO67_12182 [Aspergillus flavus]|nr:hypothetical protein NYO67_12182 [Aspergillus flavus]
MAQIVVFIFCKLALHPRAGLSDTARVVNDDQMKANVLEPKPADLLDAVRISSAFIRKKKIGESSRLKL